MANRKKNNIIYPGDGTALIELKNDIYTIVDETDLPLIIKMGPWYKLAPKINKIYASCWCRKSRKNILMHRAILNVTSRNPVDHINGNCLDNRRINLRQCKVSENAWNSITPVTNKSGVKGVHWHITKKKWCATVTVNYKSIHVGSFETIESAAQAVAAARIKHHGEFANHGQHPNQHLVTSRSVSTTYSSPMQKNMCDCSE